MVEEISCGGVGDPGVGSGGVSEQAVNPWVGREEGGGLWMPPCKALGIWTGMELLEACEKRVCLVVGDPEGVLMVKEGLWGQVRKVSIDEVSS